MRIWLKANLARYRQTIHVISVRVYPLLPPRSAVEVKLPDHLTEIDFALLKAPTCATTYMETDHKVREDIYTDQISAV